MRGRQNIREVIGNVKADSFSAYAEVSDAEVLGVAISQFFEWDCVAILDTAQAALEDANMHSLNELIDTWRAEKMLERRW